MTLPYAEYRPDLSDTFGSYTKTAQNTVPRGDGYGPFNDFAALSASLGATCRGAFKAVKSDGSLAIFAATSTKLYLLNNSTLAWGDVSLGSGTYSAIPSTDNWTFAQFGNLVFATQINAAMQAFDLTSSTNFANAGGSPPQARYVGVVSRFLVLTGISGAPYRAQWSGLNDVTSSQAWTQGVNSSDFQDFPDGGATRGVSGSAAAGIVFQDTKMRRMTYAPGSAFVFQIDPIAEDIGIYAPSSLVRTNNRSLWLSSAGFMSMQSTDALPTAIGKERVDRTILADIDKGNLQLCIGAADPRSNRVLWAYKSNAGVTGLFDKMLCYDWVLDRFSPIAMSGEFLVGLGQPGLTLEGLDSISTSIDALPASLDSYATSVTPEIACVNSGHMLGFFRGSNLEATIDTQENADPTGRRLIVNGFKPVTDAPTVYGSASFRETIDAAPAYTSETLRNASGRCDLYFDTPLSRGRIRIPYGTTWTFASGIIPDAALGGFI